MQLRLAALALLLTGALPLPAQPIANYVSEGGQPLEGFGVTPDQEVKLTRHQLLEGQDPVRDAAVTWIEKQKSK